MKKILAFISPFSPQFDFTAPGDQYSCPDGSTVTGRQTNEAPLKYLLGRDPEIQEILCILTGKGTFPGSYGVSPYDYLREQLGLEHPHVRFVPIDFGEGESFYSGPLPEILDHITPEDEIYLETTGGFRDTVSQLLLISRILLYQGTRLAGAVYSRFPARVIEDVTDTYQTFDLINGLNEFQHFAGMANLESYYGGTRSMSGELQELLSSMRQLSESITLCRTNLEEKLLTFQQCLDAADGSGDPLLQVLLPIFRQKFLRLKTIPDIVRWCLDNNMLQQALTIYNERMPRYLISQKRILRVPSSVFNNKSDVQDKYSYALNRGFLFLGQNTADIPEDPHTDEAVFRQYIKDHRDELLTVRTLSALKTPPPPSLRDGIDRILQLRGLMFQHTSARCRSKRDCVFYSHNQEVGACQGCYDKHWAEEADQRSKLRPLCSLEFVLRAYKPTDLIQNILLLNTYALGIILGKNPPPRKKLSQNVSTKGSQDYAILTIRYMEEVLSDSGYTLRIPIDDMKRICTEYLYVRAMRNQINHSNEEMGISRTRIRFLTDQGYPTALEDLSLAELKAVLYDALSFIDSIDVQTENKT